MKVKPYQVSWKNRFIRSIIVPTIRRLFHILGKVKVTGFENIPAHGPYMIVFNHVSIFDPPFVGSFWPVHPEILGAIDVWSRKFQSNLAAWYGAIPIHRGEVDRDAMYTLISILRSGFILMVSPEGGRSHKPGLRKAKGGMVFLIEKVPVQIVPVGVVGTTDDFLQRALRFQRPEIYMQVGKPFTVPAFDQDGRAPREIRQMKVDYVMQKIAELLPVEYRGFYAQSGELM